MKALLFLLIAAAAQAQYVVAPAATYSGGWVLYAGRDVKTAPLAYGGTALATDPAWAGRIVLVDRQSGGPSLAIKLKNVLDSGGIAMVIANDQSGGVPALSMGSTAATSSTVIAVSQADGLALRAIAGQNLTLRPDPPPAQTLDMTEFKAAVADFKASAAKLETLLTRAPVFAIAGYLVQSKGTVQEGSKVTFIATADGTPAPTFTWKKDGVLIPGATSSTMVFTQIAVSDSGSYVAVASNVAGTAESAPQVLTVVP